MKLTILDIAHHRNGVCGAPFEVVLFKDSGREGSRKVGIIFDAPYHCAVLNVAKLAAGDIAFGSNSFRGDNYEPDLRKATDASSPPEPREIDIHELLSERRQIAQIWSIEDVQGLRRDLDDDQAWDVLQEVDRQKDAEIGITWLSLEMAAEDLFGGAPEASPAEEE